MFEHFLGPVATAVAAGIILDWYRDRKHRVNQNKTNHYSNRSTARKGRYTVTNKHRDYNYASGAPNQKSSLRIFTILKIIIVVAIGFIASAMVAVNETSDATRNKILYIGTPIFAYGFWLFFLNVASFFKWLFGRH